MLYLYCQVFNLLHNLSEMGIVLWNTGNIIFEVASFTGICFSRCFLKVVDVLSQFANYFGLLSFPSSSL